MIQTYEAPALKLYGSVTALTSSFKCTPGTDSITSTNGVGKSASGSPASYNDGSGLVPAGTDCQTYPLVIG